jgi:hypothetical protein
MPTTTPITESPLLTKPANAIIPSSFLPKELSSTKHTAQDWIKLVTTHQAYLNIRNNQSVAILSYNLKNLGFSFSTH